MFTFVVPPLSLLLLASLASGAPLYITSVGDFIAFSNNVLGGTNYAGATVFLANDIDFSGSLILNPIGNESKYFRGTFDGQGHKISNLAFSSGSFRHAGLFGYSKGLTIRNLVLDSTCSFTSSYNSDEEKNTFIGGLIGCCDAVDGSCISENNVNMASVTFTGYSGRNTFLGGVSGQFYCEGGYEVAIRNCINYGAVIFSGHSKQFSQIGGIAAEVFSPGETSAMLVQNCANYGPITYSGTDTYDVLMGGVIGVTIRLSKIENCVNAGVIANTTSIPDTFIGGIVGNVCFDMEFANCFWAEGTGYAKLYGRENDTTIVTSTGSSQISDYSGTVSALNSYNTAWNRWVYNANSVPITFNINKGAGFTFTSSKLILLPSLAESSGLKFSGWYTDASCTNTFTSTTISTSSSMSLHGGWVYTLTYSGNGGTPLQSSKSVVYGQLYGTLSGAEKNGYTFLGWYTTSSGGNKVESNTKVTTANNHILYAHWEANKYTVTFDGNGGAPSQQNTTVTYDEAYKTLPDATRTGYTFLGWYNTSSGGDKVEANTKVTIANNHILYAHWEANNYTVTFDGNGGILSSPSQSNTTVTYYETYKTLPDVTRTGYTFLGWYTNITEGNKVETTTNVTNAYNHTLYAHWTINNYTVTFNISDIAIIEEEYQFNETIEYPANIPEMEGYMFIEWDKNITAMPDHNITINAVWSKITEYVEIVFGTKDLTENEVKEIINQYAGSNSDFTIVGFENNSEGVKVIVKFTETEEAKNFVETIKSDAAIKSVGFIPDDACSLSSILYPASLFYAIFSL